jgi:hypothetical protein
MFDMRSRELTKEYDAKIHTAHSACHDIRNLAGPVGTALRVLWRDGAEHGWKPEHDGRNSMMDAIV